LSFPFPLPVQVADGNDDDGDDDDKYAHYNGGNDAGRQGVRSIVIGAQH